jgi:hypothetical protein
VTWEQRVMEGDPKFNASQNIPNVPYHRLAEMIGFKGIYVDDPERLGSPWDEALAAKRPVVLEVKTDPEVPPLPPHITLDQAKKFSQSLATRERWWPARRVNSSARFCLTIRISWPRKSSLCAINRSIYGGDMPTRKNIQKLTRQARSLTSSGIGSC